MFYHLYSENKKNKDITAGDVMNVLNGFNESVIAYGSTGSGKTHTMQGNGTEDGLIQIKSKELFEGIAGKWQYAEKWEVKVSVQMVEIYYADISDLMTRKKSKVTVKNNADGTARFEGATRVPVTSHQELLKALEAALYRRVLRSTFHNEASSRSHTIFQITVHKTDKEDGTKIASKMTFIDLAGAETAVRIGIEE